MTIHQVFGPEFSRRLGRSLGINNVPPRQCSYSCVYCQMGLAMNVRYERRAYFDPETLYRQAIKKIEQTHGQGKGIDYLTLVPDGEPTLDKNIGESIELLKQLDLPVAVITNGSLFWKEDVREDLKEADLVSVKIDTIHPKVWQKINRAHDHIRLDLLIEGLMYFSKIYEGDLITETMLIKGLNDYVENLRGNAQFIQSLDPEVAYITIPTRQPAEDWVTIPDEASINSAYQIYYSSIDHVECLIRNQWHESGESDNVEEELLRITSVHPMREDAVMEYIRNSGADPVVLEKLLNGGELTAVMYGNYRYYLRTVPTR